MVYGHLRMMVVEKSYSFSSQELTCSVNKMLTTAQQNMQIVS